MKRPKIIFLDIDGVLNTHVFNEEAQSSTIDRACVDNFNYPFVGLTRREADHALVILRAVDAK